MPPIGETLRDARMRQKLDVADVEQATKIRAKYLRALEEEQFDRLPGATFVRTFVRTYAEFLGLDPQLLVEEYRLRYEHPDESEAQAVAPPPPPSSRPRSREGRRRPRAPAASGPGPSRTAIVAGAVVAILAILVLLGLLVGPPREDAPPGESPGEGRPQAPDSGRDSSESGPQAQTVELRVTPSAETYLCVENGEGQELINTNITQPESFRGRTLRVNLGNTLGVELEANGEEVPVQPEPNPVGLEFTADGQEEIPEGQRPCQ